MKRKLALIIIVILTLALTGTTPAFAEACYGVCHVCNGTGHCYLCDPSKNPDGLGNGVIKCMSCHSTGYIICGSLKNGDGEVIGCDGSGLNPDGTICGICNGEGKYPCDICHGVAGIYDSCRCVSEGNGGCINCCGTGWLYADRGGKVGINSGGNILYPENGDTVFLGGGQRATYKESLGVHLSPVEFKKASAEASKNDSSGQKNDSKSSDNKKNDNSTKDNSGDNSSKDNSGDNSAKDNFGENSTKDNSSDNSTKDNSGENSTKDNSGDNSTKDNAGENSSENNFDDNKNNTSVYETEVSDSSENIEQVKDAGTDMIFLFNELVDGQRISIQVIKSALTPSEKAVIEAMTAGDFDELKSNIKNSAEGLCRIRGDKKLEISDGAFIEHFCFGTDMKLPFRCDVLIELESESIPERLNLYAINSDSVLGLQINAIDNVGDKNYLIFSTDFLGEYAICEGEVRIADISDTDRHPQTTDIDNMPAGQDRDPQTTDIDNMPAGQDRDPQDTDYQTTDIDNMPAGQDRDPQDTDYQTTDIENMPAGQDRDQQTTDVNITEKDEIAEGTDKTGNTTGTDKNEENHLENGNDVVPYVIIAVAVFVVVAILIVVIKKRKK